MKPPSNLAIPQLPKFPSITLRIKIHRKDKHSPVYRFSQNTTHPLSSLLSLRHPHTQTTDLLRKIPLPLSAISLVIAFTLPKNNARYSTAHRLQHILQPPTENYDLFIFAFFLFACSTCVFLFVTRNGRPFSSGHGL